MSREVVIVSACRTAIGKFMGSLAGFTAPQLGAICIKEAIQRAGIAPDAVEEVIMGNVLQAGVGQAPARQAAIWGGVPDTVGAFTVNKVCGSGLKSGDAGRPGHQGRRRRRDRGRRHGEHDPLALLPASARATVTRWATSSWWTA